jgi:hypothetical protein
MTLDTTVAFDTMITFIILLVALLTSMPVMWREKKNIWNFGVLQSSPFQSFKFVSFRTLPFRGVTVARRI